MVGSWEAGWWGVGMGQETVWGERPWVSAARLLNAQSCPTVPSHEL